MRLSAAVVHVVAVLGGLLASPMAAGSSVNTASVRSHALKPMRLAAVD